MKIGFKGPPLDHGLGWAQDVQCALNKHLRRLFGSDKLGKHGCVLICTMAHGADRLETWSRQWEGDQSIGPILMHIPEWKVGKGNKDVSPGSLAAMV